VQVHHWHGAKGIGHEPSILNNDSDRGVAATGFASGSC
jgi:hypothetical protein